MKAKEKHRKSAYFRNCYVQLALYGKLGSCAYRIKLKNKLREKKSSNNSCIVISEKTASSHTQSSTRHLFINSVYAFRIFILNSFFMGMKIMEKYQNIFKINNICPDWELVLTIHVIKTRIWNKTKEKRRNKITT